MLTGIWQDFLQIIREEMGSRVVETWLKSVSFYQWDAEKKCAYIQAPNVFVKEWIQTKYENAFRVHLGRLLNVDGSFKMVFLTPSEKKELVAPAVLATIRRQIGRASCRERV